MKLSGDGQHLGSLRTYLAIAVIMFYDTVIRNKHKEFWEKLKTAWENSFGTVIDDKSLAFMPIDGEHAPSHTLNSSGSHNVAYS